MRIALDPADNEGFPFTYDVRELRDADSFVELWRWALDGTASYALLEGYDGRKGRVVVLNLRHVVWAARRDGQVPELFDADRAPR